MSDIILPNPYADYPPKWCTFDQQPFAQHNFTCAASDVNRFAARFRAARCFKKAMFDKIGVEAADGYSALVHILLTYSAFEHLLRCIGTNIKSSSILITSDERDTIINKLQNISGSHAVFKSVRKHVDPPCQRQIDSYTSNSPCNPFYLAAAIRHAFAHGKLAPMAADTSSGSVARVCKYLNSVLFKVMSREFESRVYSS